MKIISGIQWDFNRGKFKCSFTRVIRYDCLLGTKLDYSAI